MKTQHNKGFTLIELLVAVALASILLVAGVPRLTSVFNSFSSANTADQLISTLSYARGQAIFAQDTVSVCSGVGACSGSTTWTNGWTVFKDVDNDSSISAGDEILKVVEANIKNAGISYEAAVITFDRLGENGTGTATNFKVCSTSTDKKSDKKIKVSLVGYVSTTSGATACS